MINNLASTTLTNNYKLTIFILRIFPKQITNKIEFVFTLSF